MVAFGRNEVLKGAVDFMRFISAIKWLWWRRINGWLFSWSGCNGHNLSSFCLSHHSPPINWSSILSGAVVLLILLLSLGLVTYQYLSSPLSSPHWHHSSSGSVWFGSARSSWWGLQIKASENNSSYLVWGFQSISTEVFNNRLVRSEQGHWEWSLIV